MKGIPNWNAHAVSFLPESSDQAKDQRYYQEDQEDIEYDLCDGRGSGSDSAKTENSCYQSDD